MGAKITLRRRVGIRINIERVIWTGLHTGFATDAATIVEINDPVLAFEERCRRANRHTRGINAMIATKHGKESFGVRVFAFFDIFDPGPIAADWHIVFGFAGNGTGVTADAFAVIDQEADFHNSTLISMSDT